MPKTFNDVIQAFVSVCDLTSDSVDMIQAGGGNASAKYEENGKPMMLIKASGFLMSEVDEEKGYTRIALDKIQAILTAVKEGQLSIDDEAALTLRTSEANIGLLRPSIETFLHALLPQRYILHVHALTTLIYASSMQFVEDMATPVSTRINALLIPYEKPGIHLAMAMMRGIDQYREKYGNSPDVIILQNHGLIVASDNPDTLYNAITTVEDDIKSYMGLPESFGKVYAEQRLIKRALNHAMKQTCTQKRLFVRANEDRDLVDYLDGMLSFPDALVFCGLEPLVIETKKYEPSSDLITAGISQYVETYKDFPKVILLNSILYFCGESIKKCLDVQDVLKIQNILRRELGDSLVSLTKEQAHTLLNWEAEKYRKNL